MTTHSLLEELQALGVQFSTDGANLTINTPKGVMTLALWEQLREQKQELITQIVSAHSDQDEQLYAFARAISHMVDVLGGPGQVQIIKHERGLTLEQYTRSIRPPYQPVTLPKLPRKACPFRVMKIVHKKDGDHQMADRCQGRPDLDTGWCEAHARSHDLLCLGALLGYPSIAPGSREIGEGVAQWEAYAECFARPLARDIASIRARFRVTPEKKDNLHE